MECTLSLYLCKCEVTVLQYLPYVGRTIVIYADVTRVQCSTKGGLRGPERVGNIYEIE